MQHFEIPLVMANAYTAFAEYRKKSGNERAAFLEAIADGLEELGDLLITVTREETHLPLPRLIGERGRTCMQLRMFSNMLRQGDWVEAIIDTAQPQKTPPAPDLRRMLVPLGPVVVFGASNFPYAYSTAGGDTASALAAGCPVVVKAHPAHPQTSSLVFSIIEAAILKTNMPLDVVQHIVSSDFDIAKQLVQHPQTAAVGFTGSYSGGMALLSYAQQRTHPIPVFAEMGSVNPVILFEEIVKTEASAIAAKLAASINLGMGQFCTKPGLLFGVQSDSLDAFVTCLANEVNKVVSAPMLHEGILQNFTAKQEIVIKTNDVKSVTHNESVSVSLPNPCITVTNGQNFLQNPHLQEEVFGPYALIIACSDMQELEACWLAVKGQLTTTFFGNNNDFINHTALIEKAPQIAGRVLFNGVPTGVEVCHAMVHGGPHPASTDSRFSAVGVSAVQRWVRPVCWQNAPDHMLPQALQDANPLGIRRKIDNVYTH